MVAIHLHFKGIVASLCTFDLDFGDCLRVLRTEMLLNGVSGEFDPTFCLLPVGDEAEYVGVLTDEALLGESLGGQHENYYSSEIGILTFIQLPNAMIILL